MFFATIKTLAALGVICLGLYFNVSSEGEVPVFAKVIHWPSLLLVGSGVLGIGLLMTNGQDLWRFIKSMLRVTHSDYNRSRFAEKSSEELFRMYIEQGPQTFYQTTKDKPLPKIWQVVAAKLAGKLPLAHIKNLLIHRANLHLGRIDEDVAILKRLASLAPSIGMFGSILGLVKMLADLQNFDSLGANMSLVLLSTLYGIFIGSLMLTPLIQKIEAKRYLLERNHKTIMNWLTGLEQNHPSFYLKENFTKMVHDDK